MFGSGCTESQSFWEKTCLNPTFNSSKYLSGTRLSFIFEISERLLHFCMNEWEKIRLSKDTLQHLWSTCDPSNLNSRSVTYTSIETFSPWIRTPINTSQYWVPRRDSKNICCSPKFALLARLTSTRFSNNTSITTHNRRKAPQKSLDAHKPYFHSVLRT